MYKKLWILLLVVVTGKGLSARALTVEEQEQRDAAAELERARRNASAAIQAARDALASQTATDVDLQDAADNAARASQFVIDGGQNRQLAILTERLRRQADQRAGVGQFVNLNIGNPASRRLF